MQAPPQIRHDPGRAAPRRVLVPASIAPPRLRPRDAAVHTLEGATMGTTWSVRFVAGPRPALDHIARTIQRELDLVVAQMSTWQPTADIVRFNRAAAGSWHALAPEFFAVLHCAWSVARDSGGAFDPCAGALVDLWGFGPGAPYRDGAFVPPDATHIANARRGGGWQRLELAVAQRRARQPGGLQLDLSAIAKGYAVDRVAQALRDAPGLHDVLVEIGGELSGHGIKPDGQPWWVRLAGARDDGAADTWVALHGLCVATSGDNQRFFVRDGLRHPHTLDPRTGTPIRHGVCAVSVLHASCMWADALSTALTVLGPGAGLPWAEARGIAARWVTRRGDGGFDEVMTSACAALAA